jgi:hypothetical protein
MKLGKLLAAGKSLVLGREGIAYRFDKVSLPKFVSHKNPFVKLEKPNAMTQNAAAPLTKNEPAAKTQKLPAIKKPAPAWANKLNPISIFRSQQKQTSKPVVAAQAELSLEKVQVLRNDLSDADVEIVPLKSNTAGASDSPPAGKSWEFLSERLFKIKPS